MLRFLLVAACAATMLDAQTVFDSNSASRYVRLALDCVGREYPNKIAHVMNSDADARPPRELTPSFYGCFDWHSAAHGHWLLARALHTWPNADFAVPARAALNRNLTAANLAREAEYISVKGRESFERPYGLAWLLKLAAELRSWNDPDAARWSEAMRPVETAAVARLRVWLPKLSHPVRAGEHSQTAFALGFILDYARQVNDRDLARLAEERIRTYFLADRACPVAYEPSGEDFLSPCLAEADAVSRVLPTAEFASWLDAFLPQLPFTPAVVSDATDGKLAHLDGLNLSRAWMLNGIASALGAASPRYASIAKLAADHRESGLKAVTGEHYEGSHWLGTFAVYLVTQPPPAVAVVPPVKRPAEKVDFSYAFGTPHRITVARPSASEKTLLDLEPGILTVGWTYEDLRNLPLAIFKTPHTDWHVRMHPMVDGKPFPTSQWTRGEHHLPMLDNLYEQPAASVRLEVIGGATAALIRVTAHNTDTAPHTVAVENEVRGGWIAHNPAWMETGLDPDTLVTGQHERADRILMFAIGAPSYPTDRMKMTLGWTLAPGETRTGWIVRPYQAYQEELPKLRQHDWSREFNDAVKEWKDLLARAARVDIADAGVRDGFYAGLADLFIMREPIAQGYMGITPGTESYRAPNPFEPALAAIALDQAGLHAEAAESLRVHLEMQEPDGNWADPKGWSHHGWGASGMKAWTATEHYRLTGDRAYYEAIYPRLLAVSRWQELQRAKSRIAVGARPPEYGLMPRGMGDAGLMHGKDYFGVFYPHNIFALFADKLALEAAQVLGKSGDIPELRKNFETARADLLTSLEAGSINENGIRWIPGSANDPSGSRWGGLYALFPTALLPADHPLITGTIRKMEQSLSPGGQPLNTGWMADGAWVGITLDNLAEALLVRGEADRAAGYLYSTLNHATPLYTWCEERGKEAGTKKISGDRQHLWTPLAVVRYIRDTLVFEQGTTLHLASGTARSWLDSGKSVGIANAPTHFGDVTYSIVSDTAHGKLRADVAAPTRQAATAIVLHLRHPQHATLHSVTVNGKPWTDFDAARETVRLPATAKVHVEASY